MRIIAQMVAAYHNACLATTLSSQKDLYGKAYTPENTLINEDKLFWMNADNPEQKRQTQKYTNRNTKINTKSNTNGNTKRNSEAQTNSHRTSNKQKQTDIDHESSWDEEIHGDRLVFDANYEMNENLVPWLMRPDEWEDKYGCY